MTERVLASHTYRRKVDKKRKRKVGSSVCKQGRQEGSTEGSVEGKGEENGSLGAVAFELTFVIGGAG